MRLETKALAYRNQNGLNRALTPANESTARGDARSKLEQCCNNFISYTLVPRHCIFLKVQASSQQSITHSNASTLHLMALHLNE